MDSQKDTRASLSLIDEIKVYQRTMAKRIRAMRKKLGWNQTTLGKAAGITRKCVSDIETLKVGPRYVTLEKLANAFGIPLETLYMKSIDTMAVNVYKSKHKQRGDFMLPVYEIVLSKVNNVGEELPTDITLKLIFQPTADNVDVWLTLFKELLKPETAVVCVNEITPITNMSLGHINVLGF